MSKPQEKASVSANNIPRTRGRVWVAAALVFCGIVQTQCLAFAAESERPFAAAFTALPAGGPLVVGGGIASHLGEFDLEILRQGISDPTPLDPCVGFKFMFAVFTAANGDELWMSYTDGEICFDFKNYPVVVTFDGAVNLIGVGGTGRFTDSTGDYQMYWSGEISADGVINSGEVDGVIGY